MRCEYEITADEFASAQILYHDASGGKRVKSAIISIVAGFFLIALTWNEKAVDFALIVPALVGLWWVYAGVRHLFPTRYFRQKFRGTELAGKLYKVDASK